jgi:hypothetical protein
MPAIQSDAALLNDYPEGIEGDDNILNAFLTDPEEGDDAPPAPSKKKVAKSETEETDDDETETDDDASEETPEDEEGDEDEGEGTEDDEDEENEDDKAPKKKFAEDDDETYVKVKEGDKEHEVKVSDLKRLWGQEASLTRKSQEVAAARTAVEQDQAKNIAAYDVLLKRATERANEYRALPWTQLMKDPNVPADQLAALQAEANKALEDETFLKNEITGFMQKVTNDQLTARKTAAAECLKAINNKESPHHIKGWSDALYNDIRTFATTNGIPAETVNALTDPGAIKIIHMAMQFSRGKTKVVTKKVNKTPTKIVKNSASAPAVRSSSKTVTVNGAVKKATKSGSMDDAINAFLAMEGE